MSTTVTYKGSTLTTADNQTRVLKTSGKYLEDDITIVDVANTPVEQKQVTFFDYDGTILYSYTKEEITAMTSDADLPANPSHEGLTAQGWNWTLAQIKAQLTAIPTEDINVGQLYITTSGATEIDVTLDDPVYLSPYLVICPNGTLTINWGDGSSTDTVTGTSVTTKKSIQHTYSAVGNYTIKITAASGTEYNLAGDMNAVGLLRAEDSTSTFKAYYCSGITAIRIGTGCTALADYAVQSCRSLKTITIPTGVNVKSYAFYYCSSLQNIVLPSTVTALGSSMFNFCSALRYAQIPSTITTIGSGAFQYCLGLQSITIPNGVTSIDTYAFYYCPIKSIVMPDTVTTLGTYIFGYCSQLKNVVISKNVSTVGNYQFQQCQALQSVTFTSPSTLTTLGNSVFVNCQSLKKISVPSTVTSIGTNAFNGCRSVAEYHFYSTNPPTITNVNVFSGISAGTIIYVPSASLSTYQTASQWSNYASYMVGE